MAIGFGNSMIIDYTWYNVVTVVVTMVGGSALLMWIGEQNTEKGIGNGISIILLVNILARIPSDFETLYEAFVQGKNIIIALVAIIVILAVIVAMVAFVVLLCDGERRERLADRTPTSRSRSIPQALFRSSLHHR
jgi:preprotein translocase subunit SecY